MDWPSLVDTATRAMLQVADSSGSSEITKNGENLGQWVEDVAERLGLDTTSQITLVNFSCLRLCTVYDIVLMSYEGNLLLGFCTIGNTRKLTKTGIV